jgi:acyl-CoA synthetase (AMP-forming)/AMP-acid ligase II
LVLENSMAFPKLILEAMQNEAVTGFSGVPSTFALLLGRTHLEDYDLSSLRYMTQAGGPMPPALISRIRDQLPHISFFVMYGQTEGTARLTYLPPERLEDKLGSVGIGIPGVDVRIRDEGGNPVVIGVSGEIQVRGENVMLGYWRDPEATARTVVDGWLHTGDLGHMDEEGYVYIDGRSSEMIKSGANRISPKEIEEVIAELEEVMEVGVVGVPDDLLGQVVKAVIVSRPGSRVEARRVLAHCRQNLAAYKIPKFIEFAEELPKTASGKLQRFLLAGERS